MYTIGGSDWDIDAFKKCCFALLRHVV